MPQTMSDYNFGNLKDTFRKDTGLDPNATENIGMYISYFHAKIADYQMQLLNIFGQQFLNDFGRLDLIKKETI